MAPPPPGSATRKKTYGSKPMRGDSKAKFKVYQDFDEAAGKATVSATVVKGGDGTKRGSSSVKGKENMKEGVEKRYGELHYSPRPLYRRRATTTSDGRIELTSIFNSQEPAPSPPNPVRLLPLKLPPPSPTPLSALTPLLPLPPPISAPPRIAKTKTRMVSTNLSFLSLPALESLPISRVSISTGSNPAAFQPGRLAMPGQV